MARDDSKFEALFQHAPIVMYLWVQSGDVFDPILTAYNGAAVQLTGGRISELKGKRVSDLYSNEPQIIDDFRRCFEERQPVFRRMRYQLRSDGQIGTFRVAYIPVDPASIVVAAVAE